jgi:hypothetical protein
VDKLNHVPGNLFGCRAFSFPAKLFTKLAQLSERFGAAPHGADQVIRGLPWWEYRAQAPKKMLAFKINGGIGQ